MAVATLGAFGLGIYTGITEHSPDGFVEACAVLLFYQVGEWFQSYAAGKSRKSIASLMDIRPDYANLLEEDEIKVVSPDMVPLGATIVVKPGERVPLDGVLSFGESSLDMRALNGESMPHDVNVGDSIISGAINLKSTIHIKTTKEYG